jgi:hypothetical protein
MCLKLWWIRVHVPLKKSASISGFVNFLDVIQKSYACEREEPKAAQSNRKGSQKRRNLLQIRASQEQRRILSWRVVAYIEVNFKKRSRLHGLTGEFARPGYAASAPRRSFWREGLLLAFVASSSFPIFSRVFRSKKRVLLQEDSKQMATARYQPTPHK